MYRIYTEDKNRKQIKQILNNLFSGYTLIPAKGVWNREEEKSLIIEIVENLPEAVKKAVTQIKKVNKQQSILVEKIEDTYEFA